MIVTMIEAAELVGVSPFTIRGWVARGYLSPVRANAKPVLFREADVVTCHLERQPATWHARLDTLWRDACLLQK